MTRKKFYDIVTRDSDAAAQDALDPEGEVGEDLEKKLFPRRLRFGKIN